MTEPTSEDPIETLEAPPPPEPGIMTETTLVRSICSGYATSIFITMLIAGTIAFISALFTEEERPSFILFIFGLFLAAAMVTLIKTAFLGAGLYIFYIRIIGHYLRSLEKGVFLTVLAILLGSFLLVFSLLNPFTRRDSMMMIVDGAIELDGSDSLLKLKVNKPPEKLSLVGVWVFVIEALLWASCLFAPLTLTLGGESSAFNWITWILFILVAIIIVPVFILLLPTYFSAIIVRGLVPFEIIEAKIPHKNKNNTGKPIDA